MKIVKTIGWIALVSLTVLMALFLFIREPIPSGIEGPEAELLADQMWEAVKKTEWDQTNWISWTFADRNSYVWNKKENIAEISFGDYRIEMFLNYQTGKAWKSGVELEDEEKVKAMTKAWTNWCNDSYWLNPIVKIRDEGTSRKYIEYKGKKGLLVSYIDGGVTPGDHYLYIVDDDGLPNAMKMWVQIIPLGGLKASFENWVDLSGGAKIALDHKIGPINVEISEVRSGDTFEDLGLKEDPFLPEPKDVSAQ